MIPVTDPPSANKARGWTFVAAWFWFVLPIAVFFFRRARREAELSQGRYKWTPSFVERPIMLTAAVWGVMAVLIVLLVLVGYGDPGPTGS